MKTAFPDRGPIRRYLATPHTKATGHSGGVNTVTVRIAGQEMKDLT